ncbi:MAG: nuclear transport factor 2 family protein [Gemmatimonadota bacterium]
MKRLLPSLVLTFGLIACSTEEPTGEVQYTPGAPASASYIASDATEAEIVGIVQRLFDALEHGDADLLREVLDPDVVMKWSEARDGMTTFGSTDVEGLAARITSSADPLIERMWSPTVFVDGPLATVWTPYDFYAGAEFSHCGVDTVSLIEYEDGWRIVGLAWTRAQPPECELHPDGPPA